MTWNGGSTVDGQQSVAANKSRINGSLSYLDSTWKVDHFFNNTNSNLDGHHRYVQMPKNESGGSAADVAIAMDMDGVTYVKEKTSGSTTQEAFYRNTSNIHYASGFKALLQFTVSGTTPTIQFAHNVGSVTRNSQGIYTVNFTDNMPSDNYVVLGTAMRASATASQLSVAVDGAAAKGTSIKVGSVRIEFASTDSGNSTDPLVAMIAVVGG